MPIDVHHEFVSPIADSGDPNRLQPSYWNAALVVLLTGALKALDVAGAAGGKILRYTDNETGELVTLSDAMAALLSSASTQALMASLNAAPLDSPTFIGNARAPTVPNVNDNTEAIATTAFVQLRVAALVASAPGVLDTLVELANALGNDANFATTMTAALSAKAPLNSPALTGVPTAPTAALGTNTTQIATMAAIKAAIDALLASAPGTLDTLNELAAALGNDANFAATVTAALAAKAPLASPAFTGTPTAPTVAGTADNTTKIATTAFVQAVVALVSGGGAFSNKLLHLQDLKAAGSASGAYNTGAFAAHVINTILTNEISGASLSGNQITLPAGTYYADMFLLNGGSDSSKCRLRNVTDGATLLNGTTGYTGSAAQSANSPMKCDGRFTLAATKVLELQVWTVTTLTAAAGQGSWATPAQSEVFLDGKIWKVL